MIKIIGIAFITLLFSLFLKDKVPQISIIISVSGVIFIALISFNEIATINNKLTEISSYISSTTPYVKLMIKTLVIIILTQIISDLCRDNGENALAFVTELSAKFIVVGISLPMFDKIISIVLGLLKWKDF